MSFLDVGCGPGALTQAVSKLGVEALGVDIDPGFVAAAQEKYPSCEFASLPIMDLPSLGRSFDVVYARYLLAHLSDPVAGIQAMMSVTKPGGKVVIEDVDFDLHIAEPSAPAFARYLRLYTSAVKKRGGDPYMGRRLYALALEAGLERVRPTVQVSVFAEGAPKRISSLTLDGARAAILGEKLATESELNALLAELEELENNPRSLISIAGTYQIVGLKR